MTVLDACHLFGIVVIVREGFVDVCDIEVEPLCDSSGLQSPAFPPAREYLEL